VAVRPVDPPAFDARAANDAWLKRVTKEDGSPFQAFAGGGFHAMNRWVLGIGEYDGKGLADAVKTNAIEQNQHIAENHKQHAAFDKRLDAQNVRLAALEAAVANPPFPG
jgi:hypothetical protein